MATKLLAALLAVLTSFLSFSVPGAVPPARPAACRCLALGMDRFVTEENTSPCSANNAEIMAALFGDCLPEGTRITRRVNGPGSAEELETLIRDAFRGAGEADTSYLYLSTHGIVWTGEEGETGTALIFSDGDREEALEPRVLRSWLDRIPGKKVLILDCCHAGAMAVYFSGPEYRVLAGCGPDEDCYFWAAGEDTGMGYFTSALENALRAGARSDIDPDGDGRVSLDELEGRIRKIYGVSRAVFLPEESGEDLFLLPEERKEAERIQDLVFGEISEADGQISVAFHFRTETAVKIEYRLIPMGEDGWDFGGAARLPDRERQGMKRGVVSPGEKDRMVRIGRDSLGEAGCALLQIVSFRGIYGQVPVPECTFLVASN